MGTDVTLLRDMCERTLVRTDLSGLGRRVEGKVRDNYVGEGRRTIVVTDRVSCFDVVVGTIPLKGQVLNQLAAFWFEKTKELVPNHLLSVPDPNVSVVRECEIMPVEFVYRGYLTGVTSTSIWYAYSRGADEYCGHKLPKGLRKHQNVMNDRAVSRQHFHGLDPTIFLKLGIHSQVLVFHDAFGGYLQRLVAHRHDQVRLAG